MVPGFLMALLYFTRKLLGLDRRRYAVLDKMISASVLILSFIWVVLLIVDFSVAYLIVWTSAVVGGLFVFLVTVFFVIKKNKTAVLYFISWSPVLAASILFILIQTILPFYDDRIEGIFYGTALLAHLIFSIFIVWKIRADYGVKIRLRHKIRLLQYGRLQKYMAPHFMKNLLTNMYSLLSLNKETAPDYIFAASELYNKLMKMISSRQVSLSDELEFSKSYANLIGLSMKKKPDIQFHLTNMPGEIYIPPLIIQLIIENSVKHGAVHGKRLKVLVTVEKLPCGALIKVDDNGEGYASHEKAQERTLKQIKERLCSLYTNVEIKIGKNQMSGARTILKFSGLKVLSGK
jgi:two-component sensor histidine kinase